MAAPLTLTTLWLQAVGHLHPVLLHFPIALLLVAALIEIGATLARHKQPSSAARMLCWFAAIGAALAALSGWWNAAFAGEESSTLEFHRWFGIASAVLALTVAILGTMARKEESLRARRFYRLGVIVAAGTVAFTGHLGGEMKWGDGYTTSLLAKAMEATVTGRLPAPSDIAAGSTGATGPGAAAAGSTGAGAAAAGDPGTQAVTAAGANGSPAGASGAGTTSATAAAGETLFVRDVKPIFESRCAECHMGGRSKGGLRLINQESVVRLDAEDRWIVNPGHADQSELVRRISLPKGDDDHMPPKGAPLTETQIGAIKAWIAAGAPWPSASAGSAATLGASGPAASSEASAPNPASATTPGVSAASAASNSAAPSPAAASKPPVPVPASKSAVPAPASNPLPVVDVPAPDPERLARIAARGAIALPVSQGAHDIEVNAAMAKPPFTNDDLALLAGLQEQLTSLSLARSKVDSEGMDRLRGCKRLMVLRLDRSAVTDKGMSAVASLPSLERLNLVGTAVTDDGLMALQACPTLRKIYLLETATTKDGVARFRAARPEVEVSTGSDS